MPGVRREDSGFTLLEIMLVMLVLGMIVAMVSVSLSGSIKAVDSTLDQGDIYYRAEVAMERIREDLAAVVLPDDVEFIGGGQESGHGAELLLSFASMAHVVFDRENDHPGMALIGYSMVQDPDHPGQCLLFRSDELYRPGGEKEQQEPGAEAFLLTDRLLAVGFVFIGRDGAAVEQWNTTVEQQQEEQERQLPVAVSCTLEFQLNQEQGSSLVFETTVVLPLGMIQGENDEG